MDDRSLTWIHFLPKDSLICPWNIPMKFGDMIGHKLDHSGDVWLGWSPKMDNLPSLTQFRSLVLINPHGIPIPWLRSQGFTEVRSFAIVPSIRDARWYISLLSRSTAICAWDFYTPIRKWARFQRLVVKLLTRANMLSYTFDRVLLAQRSPSPLEEMLMQVVNTPRLSISITTGTPSARRKPTMQLANEEGRILAYMKYGEDAQTGSLVEREAQFLDYLQHLRLKTGIVPNILYKGRYNDGYLLLFTPIALHKSPPGLLFTRQHNEILRELMTYIGSKRTIDLIRHLQCRIEVIRAAIDASWYDRLFHAITAIASIPDIAMLPTVLSHGDFTPWNVYIDERTRQLALLDWEQGMTDQFLLWDAFHFKTQVDILVRRRSAGVSVATTLAQFMTSPLVQELNLTVIQVSALYVGYLVGSSVQWFEDHQNAGSRMATAASIQDIRGQMLDIALRSLSN